MEIIVTKDNLQRALQFVQTISDKKNIMPILSNVALQAGPDTLRVSATDLEVSVDYDIQVDTKTQGVTTASSKKLFEMVKELPSSDFAISCDPNHNITIRCRNIVFKLKGLPHEEFPKFPGFDLVPFSEVDASVLSEMIEKTMYAIASDDMQYNLTGIHVEKIEEGKKTRFVATDGHRLALIDREIDFPLPKDASIIVPRKGLIEIRKVIHEGEGKARIGVTDNHLVVQQGHVTLYVRLVDGVFPNYRDVIPKLTSRKIGVKRVELLEALRRASIVSLDKFRGVNMEVGKNVLLVSSNNPDVGESEEKIDAGYTGEGFRISFNSRYLTDVLGALDCEEMSLEMKDESSAVLMRAADDEDFLAVVMPMRL